MNQKERLYLICWKSDGAKAVISGFQIEAIRHSEKKWYAGEPQMDIIREATPVDLKRYPAEGEREKNERLNYLNKKLREGVRFLYSKGDTPVLIKEWWCFPKGTKWETVQSAVAESVGIIQKEV